MTAPATATFISWVEMACGECGLYFCVPSQWQKERVETGKEWHCPNGHTRVYRESEAERLRKQLAAKEAELSCERNRVALRDRQLAAARGQATRLKNRIGNGVCPCCTRSFQNLRRHMVNQHPDWKIQEVGS